MYREYVPPEYDIYLSQLIVTPQAAHGVHEYQAAIKRGYCDETALLEDLEFQDPQLYDVIDHFTEGFRMDERGTELFSAGFAVTYAALSYQADLMGRQLPELQEYLVQGYAENLHRLKDEAIPYLQAVLQDLKTLNRHLVDCWEEYILNQYGDLSSDEITAFSMGGVLMHDLMVQQFNSEQMLLVYSSSVDSASSQ